MFPKFLELDIYRFTVEDLIYSLVGPCQKLLIEVKEVDHKECSCCESKDRCNELEGLADRAFFLVLHL